VALTQLEEPDVHTIEANKEFSGVKYTPISG